jgi:DNA-binding response OmpR family regulator
MTQSEINKRAHIAATDRIPLHGDIMHYQVKNTLKERATQPAQMSQRILIADDDPVIRHLVASAVKKEGFTVIEVSDGREAYRVLQTDANFRAAIFDMMMPHLQGLDIIRYMRTEKRLMRIPAMMITSEKDLTLMVDSFTAGATVFLPKPFTSERLQITLRMLLGLGQEPQEAVLTAA